MRKLPMIGALLALFLFAAFTVSAQSTRGTVQGTVTDAAGAVLPGAEVILLSPWDVTSSPVSTFLTLAGPNALVNGGSRTFRVGGKILS